MSYCEDCGTRMTQSICPNCHEELSLITFQGEDIREPVSDEFAQKAEDQQREIERRKIKP